MICWFTQQHANARNLRVVVRNEGGRAVFSVQDDGSGFDKRFVRGLGLLGMEERVRRLGGELRIDSQMGRGTTISARTPPSRTSRSKNTLEVPSTSQ
jgi:signal transduction histidine kinase